MGGNVYPPEMNAFSCRELFLARNLFNCLSARYLFGVTSKRVNVVFSDIESLIDLTPFSDMKLSFNLKIELPKHKTKSLDFQSQQQISLELEFFLSDPDKQKNRKKSKHSFPIEN